MSDPNTVSLGNLLLNSKNFNFLRQGGVQLIQQLASAIWTDYNLHDPGITLLETLCYALTEAGTRAGAASVSDITEVSTKDIHSEDVYTEDVYTDDVYTYITNLLTSGQQIAPQDFFTCSQVLTCSPVSLTDFQKVLLDHPLIKRALISVMDGIPAGNLNVLQQFNPQVNNVVSSSVTVSATDYAINFIFPSWNDPASQPFQSPLLVQSISFQNYFTPWQQIADTGIYAASINVNYTLSDSSAPVLSSSLSILLQIVTPLASAGDLPQILEAGENLLILDLTIVKKYNDRLIDAADENNDLNSNILRTEITIPGSPPNGYEIEIAFPYWDDPLTDPFRNDVIITSLAFNPDTANPWTPIQGTDSYFSFLNFTWGSPISSASWPIVLRISSSLAGVASGSLNDILKAAADILITNLTLIKQYNQKVMMAYEASHRIRSYLKNYRNLCEYFSAYQSVRIQEVAISCTIEMDAGTAIESLLANIFYSIYIYISPQVIPQSLSDLQNQLPTEAIFEGPLLKHGFIPDALLGNNLSSNTVYVSDIIRLIMEMGTGTDIQTRADEQNRPVISVTDVSLSLYVDNRSVTTSARDCMLLISTGGYIPQLGLEKCNITVTRNNIVVAYAMDKVLDLYNAKINAGNFANLISPGLSTDIPIPVGDSLATGNYYSIQNDLPITYGVGKARLPASTPTERLAQAKQLQGYLFFFEQVLAGYFTQLAYVNALFSANATASTTLYQLLLYDVPGAPDLLLPASGYLTWEDFINDENNSYRQVLRTGPEREDQFLTRRHQMLDHLLGRLGEDMQDFSSLIYRQSYSDPNASTYSASAALLQYKADYYYALPDLEKNRAQAFGHPAWRNKSLITVNTSPDGAFFLWQILDENGNTVFRQSVPETNKTGAQETAEDAMVLATSSANYYIETDLNGLQRIALRWSADGQSVAISNKVYNTVTDAQNDFLVVQQTVIDLWLKYALSSLETRLSHLLGIAIKGQRRQLVNPTAVNEGFYIIEHILLYPALTGDATLTFPASSSSCLPVSYSLPKDLYSFILTVAFPSGYARDFSDTSATPAKRQTQPDRFRDPEFRQYAEQTIRKFCPAHILPIVVWVDTNLPESPLVNSPYELYPCFDNLESAYTEWLTAFFTDDVDPTVIAPLRNNLVNVLNGIFSDVNNI